MIVILGLDPRISIGPLAGFLYVSRDADPRVKPEDDDKRI